MSKNTYKTALYGLCIALAFILSYVEVLIPIQGLVPGMKIGLTNLVVLVALYHIGEKSAFVINMVRILLVSFTFGNLQSLWYAAAGGMLSYVVMLILKKSKKFSMVTISVAGGVFHNVGQILVAMVVLETVEILWYLAVLLITGVASGAVIGMLAWSVLKKLPKDLGKEIG